MALLGFLAACGDDKSDSAGKKQSAESLNRVMNVAMRAGQSLQAQGFGKAVAKLGPEEDRQNFSGTVTAGPPGSGSADITMELVTYGAEAPYDSAAQMIMNLTFNAYSEDGQAFLDGTLNQDLTIEASQTLMKMKAPMDGTLTESGTYNNSLTMDIDQVVTVDMTDQQHPTITAVINGSVTANGSTYTFNDETIVMTQ
jgi:hypothetical protein